MGYYVKFDIPWFLFSLKTLNYRRYISNIGSLIFLVSETKIISFNFSYVIFWRSKQDATQFYKTIHINNYYVMILSAVM